MSNFKHVTETIANELGYHPSLLIELVAQLDETAIRASQSSAFSTSESYKLFNTKVREAQEILISNFRDRLDYRYNQTER